MRGRPLNLLLLALGATFLQQTFATLGKILPAVIAPAIIDDLRIDPAWLGVYVSLMALAALVFQMGCGSFIVRDGALRMSQVALVMLAASLAIAVAGPPLAAGIGSAGPAIPLLAFAVSGVIGGGGAAVSTPASSHLLGRYAPPRHAPLVFSLKQTAVPAGLLLAGLLGPLMTEAIGWRGALLAAGAGCLGLAFLLQPLRQEFDSDRVPTRAFRLSDFGTTLTSVTGAQELRALSIACFAFNGLQSVFTAYFVVYLTALGYGLAAAGAVFSAAMVVAVPGRILWGWLGSGRVAPRAVLAGLAFGMAGSSALAGLFGVAWPVLAIGLVAVALGVTVMSWHGVLLAETARLAPEGMRGAVTGGVLSFGQVGALLMPLVYSGLLGATAGHGVGFFVCGLPALLAGIDLIRPGRAAERGR